MSPSRLFTVTLVCCNPPLIFYWECNRYFGICIGVSKLMPTDFQIPLMNSSKARPDMALLRLIVESELRCGKVIGSGAFGTVYEVSLQRLPVAIPGGTR